MAKSFYIILLYFLLNRVIGATIFHSRIMGAIYILFSQIFAIVICLQYLFSLLKISKQKSISSLLLLISLPIFSLLLSAIINYGNIKPWGQQVYPVIGMGCLICMYCRSYSNIKVFVKAIADLYFVLVSINFLFLVISPYFWGEASGGEMYFLGIENQVGYPLLVGLFFNLLEYYFTQKKKKITIYALIHIISTFIVFSATTVVSVVIMYLFLLPNPISSVFKKISFKTMLIYAGCLFSIVMFFSNIETILENSILTNVIENQFQKSTTLSGRTLIWYIVLKKIGESPFLGYGVGETYNEFNVEGAYLSAHNTILQYLYWGGVMFYISIIPIIGRFNTLLKKADSNFAHIFKCTTCAMLVAFMGEAVGIWEVIIIVMIGIVMSTTIFQKPQKERIK